MKTRSISELGRGPVLEPQPHPNTDRWREESPVQSPLHATRERGESVSWWGSSGHIPTAGCGWAPGTRTSRAKGPPAKPTAWGCPQGEQLKQQIPGQQGQLEDRPTARAHGRRGVPRGHGVVV